VGRPLVLEISQLDREVTGDMTIGRFGKVLRGGLGGRLAVAALFLALNGFFAQADARESSQLPPVNPVAAARPDPIAAAHEPLMFAGFPLFDTIVITAEIKGEETGAGSPVVSAPQCYVLAWIPGTGQVAATQIVKSSGYPRMDDACQRTVAVMKFVPATQNGSAIGTWGVIPIAFRLRTNKTPGQPQAPMTEEPIAIPAPDQSLNIGRAPDSLLPMKSSVCRAHLTVTPAGSADQITVTQSTGSPDLDKLCVDALRPVRFRPAQRDGHPSAGIADMGIVWPANP